MECIKHSKYTVGNDLALTSMGCLDDLIFLIFNFEVCAVFLLGRAGKRNKIESFKSY